MAHRAFAPALLVASLTAIASPVAAQIYPGQPVFGYPHAGTAVADQHRFEMDRLRLQSDLSAALARQQALESRLTIREVEASRQPPLALAPAPRPLRPLEVESAARRSATERRETIQGGVGQIDAWLDRARPEARPED